MNGSLYRRLSVKPFSDPRGALCVWEQERHVPYRIARAYFMYEVPDVIKRGDHAHRRLERTLIALSGSFHLSVDDGRQSDHLRLDNPGDGIYVPPMVWTELKGFAPGTVVLCLASLPYDESDYIRDRTQYMKEVSAA